MEIKKFIKGDGTLWILLIAFSCLSLLGVFSSVYSLAYRNYGGNPIAPFMKHFIIICIGWFLAIWLSNLKIKKILLISPFLFLIAILLLGVLFLVGIRSGITARWITLVPYGLSFQPFVLAKLSVILLSGLLTQRFGINFFRRKEYYKWFLLIGIIIAGLILPFNLSSAIIFILLIIAIMFLGGMPVKHILLSGVIFIISLTLLFGVIYIISSEGSRINTWKNRIYIFFIDKKENYQRELAISAIVSGGIFGKGPGKSVHRFYLPQAYSDFIYAIFCEEYGLIGSSLIILLFLLLFIKIIRIGFNSLSPPLIIVCGGIAVSIILQVLIHIGVNLGILPITGQPLPFISLGGTSLLVNFAYIGILQSVYNNSENTRNEIVSNNEPQKITQNFDPV